MLLFEVNGRVSAGNPFTGLRGSRSVIGARTQNPLVVSHGRILYEELLDRAVLQRDFDR